MGALHVERDRRAVDDRVEPDGAPGSDIAAAGRIDRADAGEVVAASGDGPDVHPGSGSGRIIASAAAEWPSPMACPRLCVSASWKQPRCERKVRAPALLFRTTMPWTILLNVTPLTARTTGVMYAPPSPTIDPLSLISPHGSLNAIEMRPSPSNVAAQRGAARDAALQREIHARPVPLGDGGVELRQAAAKAGWRRGVVDEHRRGGVGLVPAARPAFRGREEREGLRRSRARGGVATNGCGARRTRRARRRSCCHATRDRSAAPSGRVTLGDELSLRVARRAPDALPQPGGVERAVARPHLEPEHDVVADARTPAVRQPAVRGRRRGRRAS